MCIARAHILQYSLLRGSEGEVYSIKYKVYSTPSCAAQGAKLRLAIVSMHVVAKL